MHNSVEIRQSLEGLLVYWGLLDDPIIRVFHTLVTEVGSQREKRGAGGQITGDELGRTYYTFLSSLLDFAGKRRFNVAPQGSIWQDYLLDAVLAHDSPVLGALCEKGRKSGGNLRWHVDVLKHDLGLLSKVFWAFHRGLAETLVDFLPDIPLPETSILYALHGDGRMEAGQVDPRAPVGQDGDASVAEIVLGNALMSLKQQFHSAKDWTCLIPALLEYHGQYGMGEFARYPAFTWSASPQEGLRGVGAVDPIQLSELRGYEEQVEKVVANTERFLQGLPAHNILLYGDRGTGKSSTVKGLIHRFVGRGLRLIEVNRENLASLGDLVGYLEGGSLKFIVFIDDLSFEEDETEFKVLKSVLEGSVIKQPDNVRLYATSNRRHLVKESFSDGESGGELRRQDTVQEKLSLSDRFGLTVIYPSPDQRNYLHIVEHLASLEGLSLARADLRERALQWTLWHNERSGRTARQFIDDLKAELSMEKA